MRLIGLTGRSGSGKTTVARIAQTMGIPVLDCDAIYSEITSSPTACLKAIENTFGTHTVRDGALYRPALRQIVFSDPTELQKLNALTARYMQPEIERRLSLLDSSVVLLDAPTLFQSGLDTTCDMILCVIASDDACIERIVERDRIDIASARTRLDNQYSNEFYIENCDIVLYNQGDIYSFSADVTAVLKALCNEQI